MSNNSEIETQKEVPGLLHVKVKNEECTGLCVFCGKTFLSTAGLYTHQRLCKMNNDRQTTNDKTRKSSTPLICVSCGKPFAFRSGLSRHEGFCKRNEFPVYKCQICSCSFSRIDNFKCHMRKCRTGSFSNTKTMQRTHCLYENCSAVFFHKTKLTHHLKQFHGSNIEEEQHFDFKNMEEFFAWKLVEEEKTHSFFTKNSGTKGTSIYYHCQHDGSSKPHCKIGELGRKTNRKVKKGLVKQDKTCLARITVKRLDGESCKVIYQPTHSHKLNVTDYHKSPLLTETVRFINHQLAMGVSPKDCFRDLSDGLFQRNTNNLLISVQESLPLFVNASDSLYHCRRMKMRNNKDDSISVMIRSVLLSKENPNPIILYKPLGAGRIIGPNKVDKISNAKELFMLGIQTNEQRNMMLLYGKVILSIDIAYETNAYGYPLLTLVVQDEHNRGYSVGFFISSSMDYNAISCYFMALKANCLDFDPNIINHIIIPQSTAIFDAVHEGLQIPVSYIWCLWDVHKDFQQNLYNLLPDYLVQDVYSCLCLMIECKSQVELKKIIDQFILEYSVSCPDFITYFTSNYLCKLERWTMAYRTFPHGNVDTIIFNETIHNRIKVGGPCEPHTRRLDDLLNILFDIEDEDYRKRAVEETYGVPMGVGDIAISHAQGLQIPDDNVIQVHDTLWEVRTDNDLLTKCEVIKCIDSCTNDACCFVCNFTECYNLCSHIFCCTCIDKNPLCKHIHKIQELICRREVREESNDANKKIENVIKTVEEIGTNRFENIANYMKQLSVIIKEPTIPSDLIKRIETTLGDLVAECQGLSNLEESDASRYELEYEKMEITKIECVSPVYDDVLCPSTLDFSKPVLVTFTPDFDFAKLTEKVLKCGIEELSFLHLKLLDPFMTPEEKLKIQKEHVRPEWMYSTVINAFFHELQVRYCQITALKCDFAYHLTRNEMLNVVNKQWLVEKDILILPMNLSQNYWTCIAVFNEKKEILYFNPKEHICKTDTEVIQILQVMLGENINWKVIQVNYDFQNDSISCGAQVCHFAEQIAVGKDFTPLIDAHAYRKHIYDTIVGGCLKRNCYNNTVCGNCNEYACPYVTDETAELSICCSKCNQWFHIYCVGLQAMDITNMRFTCPV